MFHWHFDSYLRGGTMQHSVYNWTNTSKKCPTKPQCEAVSLMSAEQKICSLMTGNRTSLLLYTTTTHSGMFNGHQDLLSKGIQPCMAQCSDDTFQQGLKLLKEQRTIQALIVEITVSKYPSCSCILHIILVSIINDNLLITIIIIIINHRYKKV